MSTYDDDLIDEEEEEKSNVFLEWVVTAFLGGFCIYLVIKFLFF